MSNQATEHFIGELTAHQPQILGFILGAVGSRVDSKDVLQRTNLVLWRKAAEFRPGSAFLPWALAIARYEVLAYYRDRQRDRLVFEPDVGELLAEESLPVCEEIPARQQALRSCLGNMNPEERRILGLRYAQGLSVGQIASACGRSADGVKSLMFRLRKALARCIEARLATP